MLELSADNYPTAALSSGAVLPLILRFHRESLRTLQSISSKQDTQTAQLGLKRFRSFPVPRMIYGVDRTPQVTLLTPSTLVDDMPSGNGDLCTTCKDPATLSMGSVLSCQLTTPRKGCTRVTVVLHIQLSGFAPATACEFISNYLMHYPPANRICGCLRIARRVTPP